MRAFSHFGFTDGFIADLDRQFPSYLSAWTPAKALHLDSARATAATHYGYVHSGTAFLTAQGYSYALPRGSIFCAPGVARLHGGSGIVMSREQFRGMFSIGGPVEKEGRLMYIDGCTDSLLIPPVKLGDPCLNLLYFPPGIDQTAHDHPSDRIGMIMSGRGRCHYWEGMHEQVIDLMPGMIFCIHAGGQHKFSTPYGENMRVLAYHPDSDFGPTDQAHPMINRTLVGGVPASQLPQIQTRARAYDPDCPSGISGPTY